MEAYADHVQALRASPEQYEQLALSSFQEYTGRLNWTAAGKTVSELICKYCA